MVLVGDPPLPPFEEVWKAKVSASRLAFVGGIRPCHSRCALRKREGRFFSFQNLALAVDRTTSPEALQELRVLEEFLSQQCRHRLENALSDLQFQLSAKAKEESPRAEAPSDLHAISLALEALGEESIEVRFLLREALRAAASLKLSPFRSECVWLCLRFALQLRVPASGCLPSAAAFRFRRESGVGLPVCVQVRLANPLRQPLELRGLRLKGRLAVEGREAERDEALVAGLDLDKQSVEGDGGVCEGGVFFAVLESLTIAPLGFAVVRLSATPLIAGVLTLEGTRHLSLTFLSRRAESRFFAPLPDLGTSPLSLSGLQVRLFDLVRVTLRFCQHGEGKSEQQRPPFYFQDWGGQLETDASSPSSENEREDAFSEKETAAPLQRRLSAAQEILRKSFSRTGEGEAAESEEETDVEAFVSEEDRRSLRRLLKGAPLHALFHLEDFVRFLSPTPVKVRFPLSLSRVISLSFES